MQLSPSAYAGRHPIAHVDAMPTREQALALILAALRVSLAAIVFSVCAQDWPAAQAWSEFNDLPLMHANAPHVTAEKQSLLHHAAQKGPRGIEFVAVHGPQMSSDHPLLALYPGVPPPQLKQALRDLSVEITGIAAAWMVFEFLVFVSAARRAAQPNPT